MTVIHKTSDNYYQSPLIKGNVANSDYTLQTSDHAVGIDTSAGDVVITAPKIDSSVKYPRQWLVKKMSNDANKVIIKLEDANDSMYGSEYNSIELLRQGAGFEIMINGNGKYTFSGWDGVPNPASHPFVTTLTPSLTTDQLKMDAYLESLGSFTSVIAKFRYLDNDDLSSGWKYTTGTTLTAIGPYTETITVTAGHSYRVQAVLDDGVDEHYGTVLQTTANYYGDVGEARADLLTRYWAFQEESGTNTDATETMAGDTMSFSGGVTISSDTIGSSTIYKREFGSKMYGESDFAPVLRSVNHTILIQISNLNTSGDHTMINFGRNVLSLDSDNSRLQLEVNRTISSLSSAMPFNSITNIFIVVNHDTRKTSVYIANSASADEKIVINSVPDANGIYTRLARGTSGDANHQDYEYLDNGDVRSIAIWQKALTPTEMKSICDIIDNDGGLIVA